MKILLLNFWFLLLANQLLADSLPERPTRFIVDPGKYLTRERTEDLTRILERHARDNQVEVFLIIDELPRGADGLEYAAQLGEKWSTTDWGVIIYPPGRIGAPDLATGGAGIAKLDKRAWKKEIDYIQDLAVQHWEPQEKLDFLTRRTAETIAFGRKIPDLAINDLLEKRGDARRNFFIDRERRKSLLILGIGGVLFALSIFIFMMLRIRHRTRKWHFPTYQYRTRLGAPHAGGSDLCRNFPSPR